MSPERARGIALLANTMRKITTIAASAIIPLRMPRMMPSAVTHASYETCAMAEWSLEREPQRRYQTAKALAADLHF